MLGVQLKGVSLETVVICGRKLHFVGASIFDSNFEVKLESRNALVQWVWWGYLIRLLSLISLMSLKV